jgi:hypothetical protein
MTLPLFYENKSLRVVHACWDEKHISYLKSCLNNNRLTKELFFKSAQKGSRLCTAVDNLLKGKEIAMPPGEFFTDKDGTQRKEIRVKWWKNPVNATYKSISMQSINNIPDTKIHGDEIENLSYYGIEEIPVFFGHYWLDSKPLKLRDNVCCLDYSVARQGKLVSYRWDGEKTIDDTKFESVS